ncbi:hypothetical protein BBI09_18710 [Stutzerimonas xanthomarina]|uniref:molybdopterin-dependent oxidoreductase n=2 Tax=Stutzerimonas nitrititolerans TaxID=2482751 RepID=UPI00082600EA|nr:molybdopterin-dependent oxidoreductase [Stutzerimonas nitrititolerans]MBA1185939.1 molybdopterin-dependent oxidoreductase [Stutzerimonas stutzeri]OCX11841.1 hypothetical protein BBI09_18710 [Stutzerimonas xanthomarina]HBB77315.1 hypothetical protein [Pseudomonas sp.]
MHMLTSARRRTKVAGWLKAVLALAFLTTGSAWADNPFSPMLTLRMGDKVLELEREQIAALPQARLTTGTTLHPDPAIWEGPLLRDVLALLGVPGDEVVPIRISSWDDYHVEFTNEDFQRWDVILAWRVDGKELSVEELGPLRVVYPLDQFDELRDQRFHYRWVWLLRSIEILVQ